MTSTKALSLNSHLELEMGKYPDRTFFATLLNSQPQFSADNLIATVQAETEYWMMYFTSIKNGKEFLQTFGGIHHVFDALKHETDALKDLEKALQLHSQGNWADAHKHYCSALMDLHFGFSEWRFAIGKIADETHFDPYHTTAEDRKRHAQQGHTVEEPARASYADMQQVSPMLFRLYQNIDRTFCISQEITQRQITCLSNYMQEAEAQETNTHEHESEAPDQEGNKHND
jgi:hypothetical protein